MIHIFCKTSGNFLHRPKNRSIEVRYLDDYEATEDHVMPCPSTLFPLSFSPSLYLSIICLSVSCISQLPTLCWLLQLTLITVISSLSSPALYISPAHAFISHQNTDYRSSLGLSFPADLASSPNFQAPTWTLFTPLVPALPPDWTNSFPCTPPVPVLSPSCCIRSCLLSGPGFPLPPG